MSYTTDPFEHVQRGNADYFQSLDLDVMKNLRDEDGDSLLSRAAKAGQLSCCQVIHRRCPKLLYQRRKNDGSTALHQAAYYGRNDVIKFFLSVTPSVYQPLWSGIRSEGETSLLMMASTRRETSLHSAVLGGQFESAKLLVQAAPNNILLRSATTDDKKTALHIAVESHHLEIVQLLVKADPEFKYSANTDGKTPILVAWEEALSGDQKTADIRELLIRNQQAQCSLPIGGDEWTLIHHATHKGDLTAVSEIINFWPECSLLANNEGQNFLHFAVKYEHVNVVKYILNSSVASHMVLNWQDCYGNTPFHLATRCANESIPLALLDHEKVSKMVQNKQGTMALDMASSALLQKLTEDKYLMVRLVTKEDVNFFTAIKVDVLKNWIDENGESILFTAVTKGSLKCCEVISKRCPELLYKKNKKGVSTLHTAVSNGRDDIVRLLLRPRGNRVDRELLIMVSNDQCTALHIAVEGGHHQSAKLLIKADPSNKLLEMENLLQETALHMAVKGHRLEIVKLLVQAHPDYEYSDDSAGYTPLLIALKEASSGDQSTVEIRKLLIEKHARRCRISTGNIKEPLLHYVTRTGDLSVIQEIMNLAPHCSDILDNEGQKFLHIAAKYDHVNVVKYILKLSNLRGEILNQKDIFGNTPLHVAISCGNQGIASPLLDDPRVDKMVENLDGKKALDVGPSVPLHCAIKGDVNFFLSAQVDVLWNSIDEYGSSLLSITASNNHVNCCEVILKRCSELLYKTNKSGVSPLHMAASNGKDEIVKILIEADPSKKLLMMTDTNKETAMHYAVEKHHFEVVKLLVDADSDFEYLANDSGDTPIFIAVREALSGDQVAVEIRKFLIEKHASQCRVHTGSKHWTLLHQATRNGDLSAIKEIIQFVPDCCDLIDMEGQNFLHIAAKFDQVDVVKYVLEVTNLPVNILNEEDKFGNTPLHVAMSCENHDIAVALRRDPRVHKMTEKRKGERAWNLGPSVMFQYASKGDVDFFKAIQYDVLHNCTDDNGDSLISVVVGKGYLNCCEVIFERFPKLLYKTNSNGVSTLHTAASKGNIEIVKYLLNTRNKPELEGVKNSGSGVIDGKIDIDLLMMASDSQRTALHYAVDEGHLKLAKVLIEADSTNTLLKMMDTHKETPLHYAVKKHHLEIVKLLVEADSNFEYSDNESGDTPLSMALKEATAQDDPITADIRVFLIQKQTKQCKIRAGRNGWTLLQNAAAVADLSAIEEIIQFCPDCLALVDKEEQNFLHIAVSFKHENVVTYILGLPEISDSVLNGKDTHGETPLHIATKMGSVSIALSLLYDRRVRKMIQNKKGKNALDAIKFDYDKRKAGVLGLVGEVDEKELKDQSDFDLLVGALISTVSFTAGITVPGGFNSDGRNKGMAILLKNITFMVFVAFNTIALVLSLFAVFTHFCMKRLVDDKEISLQRKVATVCSIGAIFAMVVAFIMGSITVLSPSLVLVLIVCGICSIFFICAFYSMWRMRRQQRRRRAVLTVE